MRALVIQNCAVEDIGVYADCLARRGARVDVVHAYRGSPLPAADDYDCVLVGGTPISAYDADDHPFLAREVDYIGQLLARDAPVLGVCCGGQLIARCLGAEVRRNPVREIGVYRVALTAAGRTDAMTAGFPASFPVFHWHGDRFDVPAGASLLVTGDACVHQMFRRGRAVAVQFHLELGAGDAARFAAAYADELAAVGLTRDRVVAACAAAEAEMAALAERLIANFAALVTGA